MADDSTVGRFSFKRQIPALRLIEVPGLALSPFSIIFAALAAAVIQISGLLIDHLLPVGNSNEVIERWTEYLPRVFAMFSKLFILTHNEVTWSWSSMIRPMAYILGSTEGWSLRLNGVAKFAVSLLVWSLAGLFLCRRSACDFAGHNESTLQNTINYSWKRWSVTAVAPLIPILTAVMVEMFVVAFGVLGRLPLLGGFGMMITSPFLLLLGLAMSFLLLVSILTWPLMMASVAVDDCDSFGGLSRAYSSLTGRPLQLLGYAIITLFLGNLLMLLTEMFREIAMWSVMSGIAIGGADHAVDSLKPSLKGLFDYLMTGIGVSYFWTSASVIYLLIRLENDGMPPERIAADTPRTPQDSLPVVGIPATDHWTDSRGGAASGN